MTTITPTILSTGQLAPPGAVPPQRQPATPTDFNSVLARTTAGQSPAPLPGSALAPPPAEGQKIPLGVLNHNQATISDLLSRRPEFKKEMWAIIQAPINSAKPYRQIPKGTPIYLNPATQELSWRGVPETLSQKEQRSPQPPGAPKSTVPLGPPSGMQPKTTPPSGPVEGESGEAAFKQICLGRLSPGAPTVSHLLVNHPAGRADTWNMIHAPQNLAKPFHSLAPGTAIYLNSKTGELSWSSQTRPSAAASDHSQSAPLNSPSDPLKHLNNKAPQATPQMAQAVRAFMGKPYAAMDCYELVINGLEKMGVQYFGRGGLQNSLVDKAERQGLPTNTYLTGEGIIDAAGARIYAQTIDARENRDISIQKIIDDITPLLGQGDILSFSTPSRGHVGVVDRQNDLWTFINSGYLDHPMQARRPRKGVGEELLHAEIRNWLNLASRRREPLQISLGRLEPSKLRGFYSS